MGAAWPLLGVSPSFAYMPWIAPVDRNRMHITVLPALKGEEPPVPLGDDVDGAVHHLDGGLIVLGVRGGGMLAAQRTALAIVFSGSSG